MRDLKKMIDDCTELKEGSKEFMLYYCPGIDNPWRAEIGNPYKYDNLGTISGEFTVSADTAEEAVSLLYKKLKIELEKKEVNNQSM